MMKSIVTFLSAIVLATSLAHSAETGTISIPITEYEKLKEQIEAKKENQYWNMSFQQILEKKSNNYRDAWDLYDFWVNRKIYLNGSVSGGSVNKLMAEINTLNGVGDTPITIVINSPGGEVLSGMQLLNAMENSKSLIKTVCDSYAMSMAAVVFAAGDLRHADNSCIFMIHDVAVGAPGGQTMEHIKWTETVIDVESQLVDVLSVHSGLDPKEVRTLMEYETFWNAEETYRLGFADTWGAPVQTATERDIPEDLLPINRMKKNFNEKLDK